MFKITAISIFSKFQSMLWLGNLWFLVFFLIVATLFINLFLIRYFKKKINEKSLEENGFESEKKEVNHDHFKEKVLLENQLDLYNEKSKLSQIIKEKTIELAIKAKEDEDKLRLLHTIREKIAEAEENPNVYKIRLKEMRRLLDSYLEIDNKTFEIQMDELHQEFFKNLKEKYPQLSIYDLRLSAYLKIGLNSKEMSEILQVLPSSINVSRSRLRKKLGLKPEDDLYKFLNQF